MIDLEPIDAIDETEETKTPESLVETSDDTAKPKKRDYHTEIIPDGYSVLDTLPSKFLPYDTNGIYVRPLLIGEIEQLSDMTTFSLVKFLSIIRNVIKGVDVREMTVLDLKVALIYSLILSEDANGWNLDNVCEHCGTKYSHSLKVQELEFEDFPIDHLPITSELPLLQGWEFDLLRMHHLLKVNSLLETKSSDDTMNAKLLMLAFASNQPDKEKAYNTLYGFPASKQARDEMNRLYGLIIQSIKPITTVCPNPALYLTLENSSDVKILLNEFKSVSLLNEKAYLPTDPAVRKGILDFLKKKDIKFKQHKCGHEQQRAVSLDFSHLYP